MGLARYRKVRQSEASGRFVVSEGHTCGGPNPCPVRIQMRCTVDDLICILQRDHPGPHEAMVNYDTLETVYFQPNAFQNSDAFQNRNGQAEEKL